jgi:hypothetical protein
LPVLLGRWECISTITCLELSDGSCLVQLCRILVPKTLLGCPFGKNWTSRMKGCLTNFQIGFSVITYGKYLWNSWRLMRWDSVLSVTSFSRPLSLTASSNWAKRCEIPHMNSCPPLDPTGRVHPTGWEPQV